MGATVTRVQFPNGHLGEKVRLMPAKPTLDTAGLRISGRPYDLVLSMASLSQSGEEFVEVRSVDTVRPCDQGITARLTSLEHGMRVPAFASVMISATPGATILVEHCIEPDSRDAEILEHVYHGSPLLPQLRTGEFIDATCQTSRSRGLIFQRTGSSSDFSWQRSGFIRVIGASSAIAAQTGDTTIDVLQGTGVIRIVSENNVPVRSFEISPEKPGVIKEGEFYSIMSTGGTTHLEARLTEHGPLSGLRTLADTHDCEPAFERTR